MLHEQPLGNARTRQSDKEWHDIKKSKVLMREYRLQEETEGRRKFSKKVIQPVGNMHGW